MATDAQTLVNNARCLECIPPGMRMAVLISLADQIVAGGGGGGGSQTPWLSDIDGAGFDLSNVGTISSEFLVAASGAVAANAPVLTLSQEWNNAAVAFDGIVANFTNTASAAGSHALEIQSGGIVALAVGASDTPALLVGTPARTAPFSTTFANTGVIAGGAFGFWATSGATVAAQMDPAGLLVNSVGSVGFHSGVNLLAGVPDTLLFRDAAGVMAQRNTTNAQAFRFYRTFTDAANYERGALQTAAGQVIVAAETAGTGADDIDVSLVPSGVGNVVLPGGVLLRTSAALTDGAAAALGTLANAPVAGNPTKWVPVNDNGTTRYIPMW